MPADAQSLLIFSTRRRKTPRAEKRAYRGLWQQGGVTGDVTQMKLPRAQSGLIGRNGYRKGAACVFTRAQRGRGGHPLVQRIVPPRTHGSRGKMIGMDRAGGRMRAPATDRLAFYGAVRGRKRRIANAQPIAHLGKGRVAVRFGCHRAPGGCRRRPRAQPTASWQGSRFQCTDLCLSRNRSVVGRHRIVCSSSRPRSPATAQGPA